MAPMRKGDLAIDAHVDFLGVTEHRLIPAMVRSEQKRLRDDRDLFGLGTCLARVLACG